MNNLKVNKIEWPEFPTKEKSPKLEILIETHKKDATKEYLRVFVSDAVGGRNMILPIDGNDLDASELTWAITKVLRQWLGLPL